MDRENPHCRITKKRATPTRKPTEPKTDAEIEAGLTPWLWYATDREVRIAKRAPGDPSPAHWLGTPGALKSEPSMTQEECDLIVEELTVLSKVPSRSGQRVYCPGVGVESMDPSLLRALQRTDPGSGEHAVFLRFDVDVRRCLLRLRLVAEARARVLKIDAMTTATNLRTPEAARSALIAVINSKLPADPVTTEHYEALRAQVEDLIASVVS